MRHVQKKRLSILAIACVQILISLPLLAGSKEMVTPASADPMASTSISADSAHTGSGNPFKNWVVDDVSAGPLVIHGFADQGFLYTGKNNYPTDQSGSGDARFSDLAINGNYTVLPNLHLAMQVYAGAFGRYGEMVPNVDWAVVDYQPYSYLGLRAGRYKTPNGFYNESLDISAARTFIFMPMGFYSPLFRNISNAQDGGDFYGNIPIGKGGSYGNIDYNAFMGTLREASHASYVGDSFASNTPFEDQYVNYNYSTGFNLVYNTPLKGLRLGATYIYIDEFEESGVMKNANQYAAQGPPVSFDATSLAALAGQPVRSDSDSLNIWVLSTEYITGKWDFNAEFDRTEAVTHLYSPLSVQPTETPLNEQSWYVSAGYQATPWCALATYFNQTVSNYQDMSGSKQSAASGLPRSAYFQNDLALAVRFDLSRNWIVKLEGHAMNGTEYLSNGVGENPPLSADVNWFLLAAQTTWSF